MSWYEVSCLIRRMQSLNSRAISRSPVLQCAKREAKSPLPSFWPLGLSATVQTAVPREIHGPGWYQFRNVSAPTVASGTAAAPASPGFPLWPSRIDTFIHPTPSAWAEYVRGRLVRCRNRVAEPCVAAERAGSRLILAHTRTPLPSWSLSSADPTASGGLVRQPVGSGSAQIRWSIAPNSRRVR